MFKKTKILLIEDDVSMRMDFHDCIKAYPDYEIYKETGSESYALHVLNTHTVDIIILDLFCMYRSCRCLFVMILIYFFNNFKYLFG